MSGKDAIIKYTKIDKMLHHRFVCGYCFLFLRSVAETANGSAIDHVFYRLICKNLKENSVSINGEDNWKYVSYISRICYAFY